tara:strand:- start:149 stop:547 length:399 start_codon:yes stop_codon:yes gene_type:complete
MDQNLSTAISRLIHGLDCRDVMREITRTVSNEIELDEFDSKIAHSISFRLMIWMIRFMRTKADDDIDSMRVERVLHEITMQLSTAIDASGHDFTPSLRKETMTILSPPPDAATDDGRDQNDHDAWFGIKGLA